MLYDTHTITLHQDEFSFPDGEEFNWSEQHIRFLVNHAIANSDMETGQQKEFRNFGVSEIVEGIVYSKTAYIESEAGYFIISEGMMGHISVTCSRWD